MIATQGEPGGYPGIWSGHASDLKVPIDKRTLIRAGQYWRMRGASTPLRWGSVCEVLYVTFDQQITFRHWNPASYNLDKLYRFKKSLYTLGRNVLFPGTQGHLVDIRKQCNPSTALFETELTAPAPNTILSTPTRPLLTNYTPRLYTDGSYTT